MAKDAKPRVRVPANAKKGEVIEIKSLISHVMESGRRKGSDGKLVPRSIINHFSCTFDGQKVFESVWHPAISANPYMAFFVKVEKSGEFKFTWKDDDGSTYESASKISVA